MSSVVYRPDSNQRAETLRKTRDIETQLKQRTIFIDSAFSALRQHGADGDTRFSEANIQRAMNFVKAPTSEHETGAPQASDNSGSKQDFGDINLYSSVGDLDNMRASLDSRNRSRRRHRNDHVFEDSSGLNMGDLSSFGDGDGTFFDRWLTQHGIRTTSGYQSHPVLTDGIPNAAPQYGFKKRDMEWGRNRLIPRSHAGMTDSPHSPRLLHSSSATYSLEELSNIGSHTQRRGFTDRAAGFNEIIDLDDSCSQSSVPSDPQDDNYFGQRARKNFYSYYREMSRMKDRYTTPELEELQRQVVDGESLPDAQPDDESMIMEAYEAASLPKSSHFTNTGKALPLLTIIPKSARNQPVSLDNKLQEVPKDSPRTVFMKELLFHSNELAGRLETMPRSIVIIRKDLTQEINLAHHGMGDQLGIALGRCLSHLPGLARLNLLDNRLTDKSLAIILEAITHMPNLHMLDLGNNKMDEEASEALGEYLRSSTCPLRELGLSRADVDDTECCALMDSLAENKSVTSLDLSHNLIGSQESRNVVMPDFDTGGEAIAELLEKGCQLRKLNLAWNLIGKDTARQLGESLADNETLEEVDFSYNAFGDVGGQAVGDALHSNETLRVLDLSYNSLPCRATFTLAAGLRHNVTLRKLNIHGNPVGEVGGGAMMQVPIDCGERVDIGMKGCNITLRDPMFTMDPLTHLPVEEQDRRLGDGAFNIDCSVPYRRAVGMEVLRMAADRPGFSVSKFNFDGSEINLERFNLEKKLDKNSAQNLILQNAADLADLVDVLWAKYDEDNSGTVERDEIRKLLGDLSLDSSEPAIDRILTTYDVDDSGVLEKDELLEFLEATAQDLRERTKARTVMSKSGERKEFIIPHEGKLEVKITFTPMRDEIPRSTSEDQLMYVVKAARATDNKLEALRLSLGHVRLQVEQAQMFVKELRKDITDRVKVLALVLPFMSSPTHAQLLVKMNLQENYSERRRLENLMGAVYLPIMGIFTGHYELDFGKELDRICMIKLAEVNNFESRMNRFKLQRSDTSQTGNWQNYRNEYWNGTRIAVESKFFDPIPKMGELKFDFVSTQRPTTSVSTISDRRFFSLMAKNEWVVSTNKAREEMFEALEAISRPRMLLRTELDVFALELAICRREQDIPEDDINMHHEINDAERRAAASLALSAEDVAQLRLQEKKKKAKARRRAAAVAASKEADGLGGGVSGGEDTSGDAGSESGTDADEDGELTDDDQEDDELLVEEEDFLSDDDEEDERFPMRSPAEPPSPAPQDRIAPRSESPGEDDSTSATTATGDASSTTADDLSWVTISDDGIFGNKGPGQKGLPAVGKMKIKVKRKRQVTDSNDASDVLAKIRDMIYSRWFSAKQAAWMVLHCPIALNKKVMKDWKIELVTYLFPRVVDLIHFNFVMGTLNPQERAKVTHRLGWLNVWNPCYVDGPYALDLKHREDRIVSKILIHLSQAEPGENWVDETFRHDRKSECMPAWQLAKNHLNEDGWYNKGILMLNYYSGEPAHFLAGANVRGFKPDWEVRMALLHLVLPDIDLDHKINFDKIFKYKSPAQYIDSSLPECEITWNYIYNKPLNRYNEAALLG